MRLRQPRPSLFPYTTLFRSRAVDSGVEQRESNRLRMESSAAALDAAAECISRGRVESGDRKSTRLNSSHTVISYAVFCLKKKKKNSIKSCKLQLSDTHDLIR